MKFKLKQPKEWGHFIEPKTFQIKEIKGDIPNKYHIILKKSEFRSEVGKSIISTHYGIISEDKLVYLSKKEFCVRLTKSCVKYILENNELPPKTIITKKSKLDKSIQLVFTFSKQETFPLELTPKILQNQDLKEIMEKIFLANQTKFEAGEKRWKIEYAPNGRFPCKKCKKQLKTNEIKIGEPYYVDEQLSYYWYHQTCSKLSQLKEENIEGLKTLNEADQIKIKKKLRK